MAQGQDEAATLLERVKFLWDKLDGSIKLFMGVSVTKDNAKEYSFNNNCTMFIRVSFRSTTLQRLHISEFGKIANDNPKRAKETKTGTLQALGRGNTGVVESTAEGDNDFKEMWTGAVIAQQSNQMTAKDFWPIFLSWLDDPDCVETVTQAIDKEASEYFTLLEKYWSRALTAEQKNFWVVQRRELASDVSQEYPGTPEEAFAASRDGTYWSRKFTEECVRKGGITTDLYDPNLETFVYFDIGVDDYCVLLWTQSYRGETRIIAEYWNDGYDLEWYIDEIVSRGIPIDGIVFPHDIRVRQAAGGQGVGGALAKRRLTIVKNYVKSLGLRWSIRDKDKIDFSDGIEAVRHLIPSLKIEASCTYVISCMNNYRKAWDPKLKQWKPTDVHNEFSHGADTVKLIAMDRPGSGLSKMAIPAKHRSSGGFAV